jgi:mannan endo-1,4-beta-mannosidase
MNSAVKPLVRALAAVTVLACGCQTPCQRHALRLEAEHASLSGLEIAGEGAGYAGSGYVTGFDREDDRLDLVFRSSAGTYDLNIRYRTPFGKKAFSLQVNGVSAGGMLPESGPAFATQSAGRFLLRDGENTLTMTQGWGWFEVDGFELVPSAIPPPASVPAMLSDPDATPATRRLHSYLVDQYGKRTLSGQQDLHEHSWIHERTGREPAVLALDFMDYSPSRIEHGADPGTATEKAIDWIRSGGGVLSYCWHWNAPLGLVDQPGGREWYKGFYTKATTFDIRAALSDPEGEAHRLVLRDIDAIAHELRKLAEADVPVLWRPLHEAQGRWFWWGAKGPEPFVDLWRLLYQRLCEHHDLHNLIWVYSPPGTGIAATDWYPGDAWVDVVAPDIYAGRNAGMTAEWDTAQRLYGGRKLVALGECGDPPDPELMIALGTHWSWFATWTGPFIRDVPEDRLREIFNHESLVTREQLSPTRPEPHTP